MTHGHGPFQKDLLERGTTVDEPIVFATTCSIDDLLKMPPTTGDVVAAGVVLEEEADAVRVWACALTAPSKTKTKTRASAMAEIRITQSSGF